MTPWDHLRSAASLTAITLNLAFWTPILVFVSLVKLVLPKVQAHGPLDRVLDGVYRAAVAVNDFWLERVIGVRWERPDLALSRDETVVVLSNHSSWSDILFVQSLLVRDGPILKFLVKRELVWVPLLGMIFWAFDFPMLRRRARASGSDLLRRQRDLEAVETACHGVRGRPIALMNFAEGTRFRPEKQTAAGNPYTHLLRPRVGGLEATLRALGDEVDAIIDVTLIYDPRVSFWVFLSGRQGSVRVEAERIPRSQVPVARPALEEWIAERWRRKDERIAAVLQYRR